MSLKHEPASEPLHIPWNAPLATQWASQLSVLFHVTNFWIAGTSIFNQPTLGAEVPRPAVP